MHLVLLLQVQYLPVLAQRIVSEKFLAHVIGRFANGGIWVWESLLQIERALAALLIDV